MWYMKIIAVFFVIHFAGCTMRSDPVSTTRLNNIPIIKSITLIPDTIRSGETCIIRCDAVDPDSDRLEYEWETGLGSISNSGKEVFFTASGCCGSIFLFVTVKDTRGGEVKQQIYVPLRLD